MAIACWGAGVDLISSAQAWDVKAGLAKNATLNTAAVAQKAFFKFGIEVSTEFLG